jgi:hypothetical protein
MHREKKWEKQGVRKVVVLDVFERVYSPSGSINGD